MKMTSTELRRVAANEARQHSLGVDVVVVRPASDRRSWVDVILTVRDSCTIPSRLVIGVTGDASETDLRRLVRARLQLYLSASAASDDDR